MLLSLGRKRRRERATGTRSGPYTRPHRAVTTPWLAELAAMGAGKFRVRRRWWQLTARGGWLTIERNHAEGSTTLLWSSAEDVRARVTMSLALVVSDAGELLAYLESGRDMLVKWGYGHGGHADLERAVELGHWMHDVLCADASARRIQPAPANTPCSPAHGGRTRMLAQHG